MSMAVNAGVPRVAVSYGAHSIDRLLKYQPLACLEKFADIKNVLFKNII